MSIETLSWVMHNSQSRGAARLVLVALSDQEGSEGFSFTTVERVQILANVNERQVRLSIKRLVALGELVATWVSSDVLRFQIVTDTKGGTPNA